jgi:hypothetical protein
MDQKHPVKTPSEKGKNKNAEGRLKKRTICFYSARIENAQCGQNKNEILICREN